jgi:hypothetical protein
MTIKIAEARRNAMLSTLTGAIDAGAAAGTIKVYTGAQPATADDVATGTLLLTFTLSDPAFAAAAAGSTALDVDPLPSAVAVAAGTPGWARVADSDGLTVFDGTVASSGADFTITDTTIDSGQVVNLTAGNLNLPA